MFLMQIIVHDNTPFYCKEYNRAEESRSIFVLLVMLCIEP